MKSKLEGLVRGISGIITRQTLKDEAVPCVQSLPEALTETSQKQVPTKEKACESYAAVIAASCVQRGSSVPTEKIVEFIKERCMKNEHSPETIRQQTANVVDHDSMYVPGPEDQSGRTWRW